MKGLTELEEAVLRGRVARLESELVLRALVERGLIVIVRESPVDADGGFDVDAVRTASARVVLHALDLLRSKA